MNRLLRISFTALCFCMVAITVLAQDLTLDKLPIKTVNGKQYHYYVVQPKETIYSLSHKLGIDRQTIERYNPAVKDGLRGHETLYFPVAGSKATESADTLPTNLTHKAKKGESAYAIAHQYGVSVNDLVAANPAILDGVKPGDTITIPNGTANTANTNNNSLPAKPNKQAPVREPIEPEIIAEVIYDVPSDSAINKVDTLPSAINIAVMLPFQSDREKPTKQAQHYTDFLKGMLMAIDTMRYVNTPINLTVFDTFENEDTVTAILARHAIAGTSIIIAPEDSTQIDLIARWADINNAKVLNMFAVHNNGYETHPSLIQGNIPHEVMYTKAVENFMSRFKDYTPIIVSNSEEEADKSKFVDMLTAKLVSEGTEFRAITYNGTLDETQLEWMMPDKRYVFVPTSGSRVVLNSLLPSVLTKKQTAESPDNIALFGYPEWIIIRGDLLQKLHEAGTTIYSRFVMNPDNYRSRTLENRFRQWYGSAMMPTAPMYGTLGFDTGMWIISATQTPDKTTRYTGIQNGFDIVGQQPGKGGVNHSLFFINFMPNGLIESSNCD